MSTSSQATSAPKPAEQPAIKPDVFKPAITPNPTTGKPALPAHNCWLPKITPELGHKLAAGAAQGKYDKTVKDGLADGKLTGKETRDINSARRDLNIANKRVEIDGAKAGHKAATDAALKDGFISPKEAKGINDSQSKIDKLQGQLKRMEASDKKADLRDKMLDARMHGAHHPHKGEGIKKPAEAAKPAETAKPAEAPKTDAQMARPKLSPEIRHQLQAGAAQGKYDKTVKDGMADGKLTGKETRDINSANRDLKIANKRVELDKAKAEHKTAVDTALKNGNVNPAEAKAINDSQAKIDKLQGQLKRMEANDKKADLRDRMLDARLKGPKGGPKTDKPHEPTIKPAVSAFAGATASASASVVKPAIGLAAGVAGGVASVAGGVASAAAGVAGAVGSAASAVAGAAASAVSGAAAGVAGAAAGVAGAVGSAASAAASAVSGAAAGVAGAVGSAASAVAGAAGALIKPALPHFTPETLHKMSETFAQNRYDATVKNSFADGRITNNERLDINGAKRNLDIAHTRVEIDQAKAAHQQAVDSALKDGFITPPEAKGINTAQDKLNGLQNQLKNQIANDKRQDAFDSFAKNGFHLPFARPHLFAM